MPARWLRWDRAWLEPVAGTDRRMDRDRRDRGVIRAFGRSADQPPEPLSRPPRADLDAVELRLLGGCRRQTPDPDRSAVGVHGRGCQQRVDADPPVLGLVHGLGPRLLALLLVSELLRTIDDAARRRWELPVVDR